MSKGKKFVIACWAWAGLVMAGITVVSGSPNPIMAWIILSVLAGPPLIWMEHLFEEDENA